MCRNYVEFTKTEEIINFYHLLTVGINNLEGSEIRRCQVLRIKLIQLQNIMRCLMCRLFDDLKFSAGKLVLHADFSKVLISAAQFN